MKDKHLTLADLKPVTDILINKLAIDLLYFPKRFKGFNYPKLTRKEKFKYWLGDWRKRFKDCWTILRGGDIHENCGY